MASIAHHNDRRNTNEKKSNFTYFIGAFAYLKNNKSNELNFIISNRQENYEQYKDYKSTRDGVTVYNFFMDENNLNKAITIMNDLYQKYKVEYSFSMIDGNMFLKVNRRVEMTTHLMRDFIRYDELARDLTIIDFCKEVFETMTYTFCN